MPSGYISGPFYDPTRESSLGRQPLLYLVANQSDVIPADGCACQLPAHRIPVYMPDLPQVAGSTTGGVENFTRNVQAGDAFRAGDVLATFDLSPTYKVTVPAGASSTALTVTPASGAPPVSTVSVTSLLVPLTAVKGGYLSGPLAGLNSPPAVGKPIAYLVATPGEVLPAGADSAAPNATPVKMAQFGDGTSSGDSDERQPRKAAWCQHQPG